MVNIIYIKHNKMINVIPTTNQIRIGEFYDLRDNVILVLVSGTSKIWWTF